MKNKSIILIFFLSILLINNQTSKCETLDNLTEQILLTIKHNIEEWKQLTPSDLSVIYKKIKTQVKEHDKIKNEIYEVSYDKNQKKMDQTIENIIAVFKDITQFNEKELEKIKDSFYEIYNTYKQHEKLVEKMRKNALAYDWYDFLTWEQMNTISKQRGVFLQSNNTLLNKAKDGDEDSCYICMSCLKSNNTFNGMIDHMHKKHFALEFTGCLMPWELDNINSNFELHTCLICRKDCDETTHFEEHIKKIKTTEAIKLLSSNQNITEQSFKKKLDKLPLEEQVLILALKISKEL